MQTVKGDAAQTLGTRTHHKTAPIGRASPAASGRQCFRFYTPAGRRVPLRLTGNRFARDFLNEPLRRCEGSSSGWPQDATDLPEPTGTTSSISHYPDLSGTSVCRPHRLKPRWRRTTGSAGAARRYRRLLTSARSGQVLPVCRANVALLSGPTQLPQADTCWETLLLSS